MTVEQKTSPAIAVYCGSSAGKKPAYTSAARSVGRALAENDYALVYGGGSPGLMGIVSNAALEAEGNVTGIMPFAMYAGGGEKYKISEVMSDGHTQIPRSGKILVDSMHERKVQMAKRSLGFIGLPGGFGTFEEIMEVTTWTELGIHKKPVVVLNVLSYYEPLRQLIHTGVTEGYINSSSKNIIVFVDGPTSHDEHEHFDWGRAAIQAIETWQWTPLTPTFDWEVQRHGRHGNLDAT